MKVTLDDKIEAYERLGSFRAVAKELKINESSVRKSLKNAGLIKAVIPAGQKLKGISTLYDMEGNARLQWVKTNEDLDRTLQIIKEACEALKDDIKPAKPTKFTRLTDQDLLSCYVLTDYHLGQLSWAGETGEEWNTDIAEEMLVGWFARAIESSPGAHTAVLAQLGDFLHYDGMLAITPTSGHVLDADSRYSRIVNVAIRALRRVIDLLLEKHQHVHIIMAEGNHDLASSIWLRALFSDKYANEPRVTVDNSHIPYYCYEWGQTSLFYHHGHKKRMSDIATTFAGMFRDVFGRTKYSYAHMGHLHHIESKENAMMLVEQHPTLAAKDAHSARGGYASNRGASVITYHKKFGEVARVTIRPEMAIR